MRTPRSSNSNLPACIRVVDVQRRLRVSQRRERRTVGAVDETARRVSPPWKVAVKKMNYIIGLFRGKYKNLWLREVGFKGAAEVKTVLRTHCFMGPQNSFWKRDL